jgi:hypothetical protein
MRNVTNLDAIHRLEKLWTDVGEDRLWFKHSKIREIAVNFAMKLDALDAARPEVAPPEIRDQAIRLICTGLPGPNLCRMPKCECYETNGKPIVEALWRLFMNVDRT